MSDQLTNVFSALADPTRRAILHRLVLGDANVAELAEPFSMSQPAISRHLKVLEGAGLISRRRVATARFSHLEAERLKEATEYMEKYRHFWNSSFDRLDQALVVHRSATSSEDSTGKSTGKSIGKSIGKSTRSEDTNREKETDDD